MDQAKTLEKSYDPQNVEAHWYEFWQKEGLFAADPSDNGKKPYSIVIPPPNVTGVLHMGHALNVTLQDMLCRFYQAKGKNVLWMPGTDHAGIATQNVVEKQLAAEGTDRHALGRDKFIERVWEWREQYGGAIINQLKRLGSMCDWDRERFTMDEGLSRAVRKVFVTLHDQGLIYKGDYIINWCPRCNTALADLEVEHEEIPGNLYHIQYPLADGSGHLTVATTRPETMLGDTAVAIHPDDERYANLSCDEVILPLMDRKIPIIRDEYVDKEFGTGALKVTPAHDPNDFDLGRKHDLPNVKVIADDGIMSEEAGKFAGLDRFEARKQVVAALKDLGLFAKIEDHEHGVGHCYRCKTIVEPNLSKQWFVKVKPLADKAIEAVESGKTRIVPETWTKTYYDWMYNIRDWCISRQIWWGHRIPAWTCTACGKVIVTMEDPTSCPDCGGSLEQETDVLDTWFSSALWPFSTMGWPDETPELEYYYPTSVLVTGFDILFFWVARMMMMGIHFMDDVPFHDVYIHALVRDEHGKKMSKSKGNVMDPLEVMDKLGTDAFRFTLAAFAAQGRDIKLSVARIEGYRHFINKIWNAARFALPHMAEALPEKVTPSHLSDKWIMSRLATVSEEVEKAIVEYRFNEAAGTLYQFVWHELCDWHLEAIKPVLYGADGPEKDATSAVLAKVFSDTLVLLHPIIPFVTEELWHRLPFTTGSIMQAAWPDVAEAKDPDAEAAMHMLMETVSAVRNIRSEMNIGPSKAVNAAIHAVDDAAAQKLNAISAMVQNLARVEKLDISVGGDRPRGAATALAAGQTLYVLLEGILDLDKEITRLDKGIQKLDKELLKLSKKLNNESFLKKAPDDVVEKVRFQEAELSGKREHLAQTLEKVKEIHAEQ